jgi:hypothetical protein
MVSDDDVTHAVIDTGKIFYHAMGAQTEVVEGHNVHAGPAPDLCPFPLFD